MFKKLITLLVVLVGVMLPAQAQGSASANVTSDCDFLTLNASNGLAIPVTYFISAVEEQRGNNLVSNREFYVANGVAISEVIGIGGPINGVIRWSVRAVNALNQEVLNQTGSINCVRELNRGDANRPFKVFCDTSGGVSFIQVNNSGQAIISLQVTVGQLARALVGAAANGVNQPAASNAAGLSVWGLTSGELQAVYRGPLGNYDFIFPTNNCGGIDISGPINVVITNTNDPGAIPVPPAAPAPGTPPGAGVIPPTTGGTCRAIAPNTRAHVVQQGQNLFRIGLAYGVPFRTIANVNNISNVNRIFPGQCLQIP